MEQENVTIQTLAENEDVLVGYSDNDIVIVDSIQRFAEFKAAHVAMNAVVICTNGKVQGLMNGSLIQLQKNQVAIIPDHVMVTELMMTPDFDMKAMFLTTRILQSFLREKITIWNDMMYVHRLHIITMDDEDLAFYTHFYEMLSVSFVRGKNNPFRVDVIQALLRAAILGLCGGMAQLLPVADMTEAAKTNNIHFQEFLGLLHSGKVKPNTVEAYASRLCISPKYLTVICKKQTGKGAHQWIREKMLEEIRYYLKQTDLSFKQIADAMGFSNPSFFGRYVKHHFGMTPGQIRQQQ
ncbi:MAG: helix-turn-helix domain-containing protein [Prevotella sp.]|nr:helix-turn-helix domain-containing protein [Prevotella sp.]